MEILGGGKICVCHMTHSTFCALNYILISRGNKPGFVNPLVLEARLGITLWKLATNVEYRTRAALFGVGRSTVGEVVLDTCEAISQHLLPKYVCIPRNESLHDIVDGFE